MMSYPFQKIQIFMGTAIVLCVRTAGTRGGNVAVTVSSACCNVDQCNGTVNGVPCQEVWEEIGRGDEKAEVANLAFPPRTHTRSIQRSLILVSLSVSLLAIK